MPTCGAVINPVLLILVKPEMFNEAALTVPPNVPYVLVLINPVTVVLPIANLALEVTTVALIAVLIVELPTDNVDVVILFIVYVRFALDVLLIPNVLARLPSVIRLVTALPAALATTTNRSVETTDVTAGTSDIFLARSTIYQVSATVTSSLASLATA